MMPLKSVRLGKLSTLCHALLCSICVVQWFNVRCPLFQIPLNTPCKPDNFQRPGNHALIAGLFSRPLEKPSPDPMDFQSPGKILKPAFFQRPGNHVLLAGLFSKPLEKSSPDPMDFQRPGKMASLRRPCKVAVHLFELEC